MATTQDVRVSMVAAGMDEYVKTAPAGIDRAQESVRLMQGRHHKAGALAMKCVPRRPAMTLRDVARSPEKPRVGPVRAAVRRRICEVTALLRNDD
jgi:hypothetical protein